MEEKIEVGNIQNEKEKEKENEVILIDINEDSYKFILIDAYKKFFLIKILYKSKITEVNQIDKNNIELFSINNEIERGHHLKAFDGFIFIFNPEQKDNPNFIINYIIDIEKKTKNKIFLYRKQNQIPKFFSIE